MKPVLLSDSLWLALARSDSSPSFKTCIMTLCNRIVYAARMINRRCLMPTKSLVSHHILPSCSIIISPNHFLPTGNSIADFCPHRWWRQIKSTIPASSPFRFPQSCDILCNWSERNLVRQLSAHARKKVGMWFIWEKTLCRTDGHRQLDRIRLEIIPTVKRRYAFERKLHFFSRLTHAWLLTLLFGMENHWHYTIGAIVTLWSRRLLASVNRWQGRHSKSHPTELFYILSKLCVCVCVSLTVSSTVLYNPAILKI